MLHFKLLATAALLSVAVANTVQAQLRPDSLTMRFRVGLQTASNRYEVLYPKPTSSPSFVAIQPFLVSVGVMVRPKLEIQLGYAYWQEHENSGEYTGTTTTGANFSFFTENWNKAQAFPLLARYRLTKPPRKRVQFDALLGTTLVEASFRRQSERREDGVLTQQGYDQDQALQVYVTAGVGARVLFGRHWQAVWDITASRNLRNTSEYVHQQVTGNRLGITRAANIGVHYRFNAHLRKKQAAK